MFMSLIFNGEKRFLISVCDLILNPVYSALHSALSTYFKMPTMLKGRSQNLNNFLSNEIGKNLWHIFFWIFNYKSIISTS